MTRTDRELLEAWREGDVDAGDTLFQRHFPALYRFFRNKAGEEIDDLVQTTFLGCVEGRDRWREEATFRTYMFSIARRKLYDRYDHARRDGERFADDTSTAHDQGPSPSRWLAEQGDRKALLTALRSIPVANQIALELYYVEGLRGPEIAEILDVPEGTVRGRLKRALEQLRERVT